MMLWARFRGLFSVRLFSSRVVFLLMRVFGMIPIRRLCVNRLKILRCSIWASLMRRQVVSSLLTFLNVSVMLKTFFLLEVLIMRPLKRNSVSKVKSARRFRHDSARTKAPNLKAGPMRGGIRL